MERAIPTFPAAIWTAPAPSTSPSASTLALAIRPTPSSSAAPWSCTCRCSKRSNRRPLQRCLPAPGGRPGAASPGRGPRPGRPGIPRITALEDQPWGMREFALVDPDGNLLRVGQELDATPEQHRVRLASADDVPAVAALWQANVREAGETLDAGDQQAIQALLLAASRNRLLWLAEAQQHPAVSSSPTCGRSRTVRHGSERSQSSTYCRRPAARAWPGNWWAAPRRPCARGAPA